MFICLGFLCVQMERGVAVHRCLSGSSQGVSAAALAAALCGEGFPVYPC